MNLFDIFESGDQELDENLRKWFKDKWVRFGPDGEIRGDCARGDDSEGKPKCLPQSKAQSLGKKGRASAAARKRREDPNPERSGKAINVNTKKKSNEGMAEGYNDLGPEYGGAYVNGRSDDAKMTARLTRQAKAAAAKAGKTFGTSAEYRKWHARQKEKEGVAEAINPDITNPEFSHQQQIGDYLYVARYWGRRKNPIGLKISAYHGNKLIGYADLMYHSAPFDDFADPETTPNRIWLESEITKVNPKYQRQGIMSTMYAYARMLGNTIKPSGLRSPDAKAAWASWRQSGDKEHLTKMKAEGVAEGSDDWSGPLYDPALQGNGKKQRYEMMFKNGQVKRFSALNDNEARKIAAGHSAKSVIRMKGNVPSDKIKEQGAAEGLNEMDKTQTPPGRDGGIDWTKKQIHLGPEHVIKAKDVAKHALKALDKTMKKSHADTPKKKGVEEAFGPLPREKQQIRLGRHTVDIERVGLDKNYISFAWNDSKGREHYEEVPVGDLGSYDDLIDRIKQEIRYQERKYTDQGVAEGLDQPREAGKAIQSLKNLAVMKSALTMQQLTQAGREAIVSNAINAAKTLEQSYLQNKQQGNAIFVRALRDEIDNFMRGAPINASFPETDTASELGELLQGKLGKVNFQQGVAEGSEDEGSWDQGWDDGYNGYSYRNQFPKDSVEYKDYLEGFRDGRLKFEKKGNDSDFYVPRPVKKQDVAEGSGQLLSVQQLAAISDAALDQAYGYGRSTPGNTFGWQANLMSAAYAKKLIDAGVTDIEKISDAIHKGWNVTAQKFVQNPEQFDDTEKLRQAGKLEAKLQQRAKLMKINYAQLDNEEQEKDRVVARALLQAIKSQQGVAEGVNDTVYPNATVIKSKNGRPVGEIYQDGNSWGCFHYRADRGYDMIDTREEAIEALKDLHQETGRSRPDYTIKGVAEGQLDEKCWDTHKQVGMKKKGNRMVPNCVPKESIEEMAGKTNPDAVRRIQQLLNKKFDANLDIDGILGPLTLKSIKKFLPKSTEKQAPNPEKTTAVQGKQVKEEKCPHCGGEMVSEELINEKKDACYYKVKSRYKVWPSAYASGALVKCRKKGADSWGNKSEGLAEGATDDPRFQKMMGNIQQSTPNPVNGYVAVSYASERPSKKIKGVTYNGKPMPSTVDPEGFASSKIKFTPDQIEAKLAGIGQKYGWDRIDPGHGQGYDELYFDTSTKYTSATQRKLATNIVKTVNEINKFFNDINRSLQATGLPGYKASVWQGMGENGNINQYEDLSHITNIAKGQTAKPDAGPAIGKMILKHLPSYEAENDELGYDPQDFQDARNIANIYITKGERAGLQAQHDYDEVSDMIDELLSDAGGSDLRTIWDDDEQGMAEGLNEFDAQGFQQRYTLYKDGYEIEKFGDIDDAIEYAEDDRRDGDTPLAVYKIVDINKQVVWDSDPYEKPSRIQLRKPEQGVAEAKSPAEFIGQMKKLASTEQQFNVGDWVTIDPNETSGYASSGMIGRIIELYDDEGESMAKIAVGGGSGVQKKLGKGVRSSGTHTVVPTSILQKDDPQGVAEDRVNEKWTQKYKDSINCSNPKGFSQKAHCAGKKKNEDITEGKEYYTVTGTDSVSLRRDFNMSKDRNGWYLKEGATPKQKLEAFRAFGSPKLKEFNLAAFSGGTQTKGEDNVISPVGSQIRSQYKK